MKKTTLASIIAGITLGASSAQLHYESQHIKQEAQIQNTSYVQVHSNHKEHFDYVFGAMIFSGMYIGVGSQLSKEE